MVYFIGGCLWILIGYYSAAVKCDLYGKEIDVSFEKFMSLVSVIFGPTALFADILMYIISPEWANIKWIEPDWKWPSKVFQKG